MQKYKEYKRIPITKENFKLALEYHSLTEQLIFYRRNRLDRYSKGFEECWYEEFKNYGEYVKNEVFKTRNPFTIDNDNMEFVLFDCEVSVEEQTLERTNRTLTRRIEGVFYLLVFDTIEEKEEYMKSTKKILQENVQ